MKAHVKKSISELLSTFLSLTKLFFIVWQVKAFVPASHSGDRECVAWLDTNGPAVEQLVHTARKEFTASAVSSLLKVTYNEA